MASYIYLKNETNYDIIKNDIYRFFDSQISLKKEDYNPSVDPTTYFMFYIYKKTNILNKNFIFNENANPDANPIIDNHNSDIIAVVSYKIAGESKTINFFSNKRLDKLYSGNTEKAITASYRETIGDLE